MIRKTINTLALLAIAFGAAAAAPAPARLQDPAMCKGGTEVCVCESGKCYASGSGCSCR